MDINVQNQIQLWREKARKNEMTPVEYREVINYIRQGREAASKASDKSKTTRAAGKAKANVNSDDLLSELDGI